MAPKGQKVVTVHRLMAVFDQPDAAARARQALVGEGFAADAVAVLQALRDGRAVITVRAPSDQERDRAKRVLAAAGAHFMNYFGRVSTEDISRWRGRELPLHPDLYR